MSRRLFRGPGESPLDMVRRINPKEITMRVPVEIPKPLIGLHPGNTSWAVGGEVEKGEEEEEEEEEKVEEGATRFTQEFEATQQKKAMWVATP